MSDPRYSIVVLGLSITSSWGNGHATTYRALVKQLVLRGHGVLFLERERTFYRDHRDLPAGMGRTALYESRDELFDRFGASLRNADVVILGSYVPEGIAIGEWLVANVKGRKLFYDIDTPVTLRDLAEGHCEYLSPALVPRFDLYLSFTGGPTLQRLEGQFGARRARPLYCSVDPTLYCPDDCPPTWDLGYLGTYSDDRQPALSRLLMVPAAVLPQCNFVVAGAQYPPNIRWPANVRRIEHVPPGEHSAFYNAQRFTLNVTRRDMIAAGYSPSVRLFEAAACATPIVSDTWLGIESFFVPGREILLANSSADVAACLTQLSVKDAAAMGTRARKRVLAEHTAAHRVEKLERYISELPSSTSHAKRGPVLRVTATNEADR